MVARLQEGEKCRLNRGHTRRSSNRAFCAFQSGDTFFKSSDSRIGGTGISKPFDFFGKQVGGVLGVVPHEAAGEKQCLIVFAVFGLFFAAAYGERLRVEFFTHLFSNLVQQVCLMSYREFCDVAVDFKKRILQAFLFRRLHALPVQFG